MTEAETDQEQGRMRALVSVYDKTGVERLAEGVIALGYEIVSTGGTLCVLEAAGVPLTGFAFASTDHRRISLLV